LLHSEHFLLHCLSLEVFVRLRLHELERVVHGLVLLELLVGHLRVVQLGVVQAHHALHVL